jgi:hypothetical protein
MKETQAMKKRPAIVMRVALSELLEKADVTYVMGDDEVQNYWSALEGGATIMNLHTHDNEYTFNAEGEVEVDENGWAMLTDITDGETYSLRFAMTRPLSVQDLQPAQQQSTACVIANNTVINDDEPNTTPKGLTKVWGL